MARHRSVRHPPADALRVLAGGRLSLTPPEPADAAAVFAYTSDPRASHYLGWRPHRTSAETGEFLAHCAEGWREGGRLRWLIRHGDEVVGMIEAQLSRALAGVGYVIAPRHWGNGYATEALSLVVAGLFEQTSVPSVWAVCDVENFASARVLEKSGFAFASRLANYRSCPNIGAERRDFFSYVRCRD